VAPVTAQLRRDLLLAVAEVAASGRLAGAVRREQAGRRDAERVEPVGE
jgi:hypothetical protein